MKRFAMWAVLLLTLMFLLVPLFAFAADGDTPTVDAKTMIIMAANSLAAFLIGLAIKKWPVLDGYSNRLIPYTIVLIATFGYMLILKMGFVDALLMAGASSMGAVLLAEGPLKSLTQKPPAVGQ